MEWDKERNYKQIVHLLLIYQLFKYINDEIDYEDAQETLSYLWESIKNGTIEHPLEL